MRRAFEVTEERILVAVACGYRLLERQRALGLVCFLDGSLGVSRIAKRDHFIIAADTPIIADTFQKLLRLQSTVLPGGFKGFGGGLGTDRPTIAVTRDA